MQLLLILGVMAVFFTIVGLLFRRRPPSEKPIMPSPETLDAFVADQARVECEELPYRNRFLVDTDVPPLKPTFHPFKPAVSNYFSPEDLKLCIRILDLLLYGVACKSAADMPEYIASGIDGVSEADVCALAERIDRWHQVNRIYEKDQTLRATMEKMTDERNGIL